MSPKKNWFMTTAIGIVMLIIAFLALSLIRFILDNMINWVAVIGGILIALLIAWLYGGLLYSIIKENYDLK